MHQGSALGEHGEDGIIGMTWEVGGGSLLACSLLRTRGTYEAMI